jgi:hypothetical protein
MALRRPRDSSFPAGSRETGSCKLCLQTASGTCRVRRSAWPAWRGRSGCRPLALPPPSTREGRHRRLDRGMGGSGCRIPVHGRRHGSDESWRLVS